MDLDATAGGVFDGLLGLFVEAVVLQAATGRPQGSDVGAGEHARPTPVRQEDVASVRAGWRAASRRWNRDGRVGKGHVCVFASERRKCFGLRKECARKEPR